MSGGGEGSGGNASSKNSNLRLRVISALVLGPAVLLIAWFGGIAFTVLALAVAILFLFEWLDITGNLSASQVASIGYAALGLIALAFYLGEPGYAVAMPFIGAAIAFVMGGVREGGRWAGAGVLYAGLSLYALIAIRNGAIGLEFLFFLLIAIWATDVAAYFTGRALGGPKLWPRVSPKKTWSGALGGLAAAAILGTAAAWAFGQQNLVAYAVLAVILSIASQLGDMLESAVKRRFDVKDSSQLIPGHGGIMDRVDGLVAAAIVAVALGFAFGGSVADPISGLPIG